MASRDDFLQYLGAAGGAIVLLFLAQAGLRSCLDVSYHHELAERPANQELVELRKSEQAALEQAGIEGAMAKVAKSRTGEATIKPKASDDLSPMTGWIQSGNQPYEPQVVAAPTANPAASE